jgi:hypothetical protein
MTIEITLPATPEEAHEAIAAALDKVLALEGGEAGARAWLDKIDALQRAAHERWPDEGFEPYEPCPKCQDVAGVPCDLCDPPTDGHVGRMVAVPAEGPAILIDPV